MLLIAYPGPRSILMLVILMTENLACNIKTAKRIETNIQVESSYPVLPCKG